MLSEAQTARLAGVMHAALSQGSMDAGYTYFGQLIAHDIVAETRPAQDSRTVGIGLNLDSIYGTAGGNAQLFDSRGRFLLGPVTAAGVQDLRRADGTALIPERRNDENVIVAQLHLLWQKLHNAVIDYGWARDGETARHLVTRVFQLLVVEDFLRQILNEQVYESCFDRNLRRLDFGPEVPTVFSHAVYRFGHSMVRDRYESFVSGPGSIPLSALFHSGEPLDPRCAVDWKGFFGWPMPPPGVFPVKAMPIDPFITPAMSLIPVPRNPQPANIIQRNLEAGTAAGLPTGTAYVHALLASADGAELAQLGLRPLQSLGVLDTLAEGPDAIRIDELPLWPYVLLEADQASDGDRLGVLGSLVCAEVLANAIAAAANSIYSNGRYDRDQAFAGLGGLGQRLDELIRHNAERAPGPRTLCMRHIVELVEAYEKETPMATPEILRGWVAEAGQQPTKLVNPTYIDYRAWEELHPWFPTQVTRKDYKLLHLAATDQTGAPYVRVHIDSGPWTRELVAINEALMLYPQTENGVAILLDRGIKDRPTPTLDGWRVTEWRVVKNTNSDGEAVHQDLITWEKGGTSLLSLYSWRPYAP